MVVEGNRQKITCQFVNPDFVKRYNGFAIEWHADRFTQLRENLSSINSY